MGNVRHFNHKVVSFKERLIRGLTCEVNRGDGKGKGVKRIAKSCTHNSYLTTQSIELFQGN